METEWYLDEECPLLDQCLIKDMHGVMPLERMAIAITISITVTTLWRICFSQCIGKRCGAVYAEYECGDLSKPSLLIQTEDNPQSQWKLKSLKQFAATTNSTNHQNVRKLNIISSSLNCSTSEIVEYVQYVDTKKKYQECCYKFSEEFWKCVHMLFLTIYGCTVIYDAAYFWDTSLLYAAWPQSYTHAMEVYHTLSIGYHGHRALWQVFDTKRKDF